MTNPTTRTALVADIRADRALLDQLIEAARDHKMTPAEWQQQRISFAYGNLPEGSPLTKEDVARLDYDQNGNLAEMEAQIIADAARIAELEAQIASITSERSYIVGWNHGFAEAAYQAEHGHPSDGDCPARYQYTAAEYQALEARVRELECALGFYADPETYAAILVMADRPAGAFADDISEVEHPFWETSYGATASRALNKERACCRKCGAEMRPGIAMGQTYTAGGPDFPGDDYSSTFSAGGPGRVMECLKCPECGWSVEIANA